MKTLTLGIDMALIISNVVIWPAILLYREIKLRREIINQIKEKEQLINEYVRRDFGHLFYVPELFEKEKERPN